MKIISSIFTVCFAFAITISMSMGMGYPQDLFAEHLTPKRVTIHASPKKNRKFERTDAQKAACSPSAQGLYLQGTSTLPCRGKSRPKQNKGKRQVVS
jgi:hypothetical protein